MCLYMYMFIHQHSTALHTHTPKYVAFTSYLFRVLLDVDLELLSVCEQQIDVFGVKLLFPSHTHQHTLPQKLAEGEFLRVELHAHLLCVCVGGGERESF
jgi:hypothetical protein